MTLTSIAIIVALLAQAPVAQTAALSIVVIEGEDAVNIIQQKTAVAPIIEVRDRNNIPVAGATVVFTVGGNAGTFAGGLQTLTVVTNSAGRAIAAGLNPLSSGAMQINVAATFQGQAAAATITQTNFVTAAQAASAASGAGGGAGSGGAGAGSSAGSTGATTGTGTGAGSGGAAAGGGAAGAGGGLSGLAIGGIVGGAAALGGGILVATGGGDDSSSSGTSAPATTGSSSTSTNTNTGSTAQPTTAVYNGPISGLYTSIGSADTVSCTFTYNVTGTMRIELTTQSGGTVTGTGSGTLSFREAGGQCTVPFPFNVDPDGSESGSIPFTGSVSGTTSSFRFSQNQTQNIPITGGSGSTTFETSFTGSQNGSTITGQLALTSATSLTIPGLTARGSGTGSMTVTLNR